MEAPDNLPPELSNMIDNFYHKAIDLNFSDEQTREFKEQIKLIIARAFFQEKIFQNDWTKQSLPFFNKNIAKLELHCNMNEDAKNKCDKVFDFDLSKLNSQQKEIALKNQLASLTETKMPDPIPEPVQESIHESPSPLHPPTNLESNGNGLATRETVVPNSTKDILSASSKTDLIQSASSFASQVRSTGEAVVSRAGSENNSSYTSPNPQAQLQPQHPPQPQHQPQPYQPHQQTQQQAQQSQRILTDTYKPSIPGSNQYIRPASNSTPPSSTSNIDRVSANKEPTPDTESREKDKENQTKETLKRSYINEQPFEVFKKSKVDNNEIVFEYPLSGSSTTSDRKYKPFERIPDLKEIRTRETLKSCFTSLQNRANSISYSNHGYIDDQLKSIEQDLFVQKIENSLTIKVYEYHLRFLLKTNRLKNYISLSKYLSKVYFSYIGNTAPGSVNFFGRNRNFFLSLTCLCLILLEHKFELIEFIKDIQKFTPFESENSNSRSLANADHDKLLRYVIRLSKYYCVNNYHEFFKLYNIIVKKFTGTSDWVLVEQFLNLLIMRERIIAVNIIAVHYKKIMLEVILYELRFDKEEDCLNFLKEITAEKYILIDDNVNIDCLNLKKVLNAKRKNARNRINKLFLI